VSLSRKQTNSPAMMMMVSRSRFDIGEGKKAGSIHYAG
jgi:hypothetical protein